MKKIIVHVRLNGVPGRNELNGIFRYLARKEDWDFRIVQDEAALEVELRQSASGPGRPDGFIISAPVSDEVCRLVARTEDARNGHLPDRRCHGTRIGERFRQFQQETILGAITRIRLEELKRRLRTTDAPIRRITSDCGFSDPSYVKVLFRRKVGMTMRDYRASARD